MISWSVKLELRSSDWLVHLSWGLLIGWFTWAEVFWLAGSPEQLELRCSDWLVHLSWGVLIGWFTWAAQAEVFWLAGSPEQLKTKQSKALSLSLTPYYNIYGCAQCFQRLVFCVAECFCPLWPLWYGWHHQYYELGLLWSLQLFPTTFASIHGQLWLHRGTTHACPKSEQKPFDDAT